MNENSEQPQSLADLKPWNGKATWVDKVLLTSIFVVPVFYLVLLPARPFLILNAPVVLEFLTGSKTGIVGAAAFARIGEIPLWLVLFAGTVGMAKFDWLFWLAGRRWGEGILRIFTSTEKQRRQAHRFRHMPKWLLFVLTVFSHFPGIPGSILWLVVGWNGMRLWLFLLADVVGAFLMTAAITGLGWALGQSAVDVIGQIDKYALWISLGLVVCIVAFTTWKSSREVARSADSSTSAGTSGTADPEAAAGSDTMSGSDSSPTTGADESTEKD